MDKQQSKRRPTKGLNKEFAAKLLKQPTVEKKTQEVTGLLLKK